MVDIKGLLVSRYQIEINGGKANADIPTIAGLLGKDIAKIVKAIIDGQSEFHGNGYTVKILNRTGVRKQWLERLGKYRIEYKGGRAIATPEQILDLADLDRSYLPKIEEGAEFLDGELKIINKITRPAPVRPTKSVKRLKEREEEEEEEEL